MFARHSRNAGRSSRNAAQKDAAARDVAAKAVVRKDAALTTSAPRAIVVVAMGRSLPPKARREITTRTHPAAMVAKTRHGAMAGSGRRPPAHASLFGRKG